MGEGCGGPGLTRTIVSLLVFVVLQVAFLPLALIGVALITYKQIFVSRRLGVSQTGIEVLHGRWTMHVFGIRDDPVTARLAAALPNTSRLGLWLCLFPLWLKYKMSGSYFGYPRIPLEGAESVADIVVARTLYFDRIIGRVLDEMDQFVLMGAGYDTRAYGDFKRDGLAAFELDQPKTQELKAAALSRSDIVADHVAFVPVDFRKKDSFERLQEAGYDPGKRTLFLWEGVTLYLAESDVRDTLRGIVAHSPPGSVVVADIYAERFIRMGSGRLAKKSLELTGEGFGFGLPFEGDFEGVLQDFLSTEGVRPGEIFFLGKANKKGPFMAVVECLI